MKEFSDKIGDSLKYGERYRLLEKSNDVYFVYVSSPISIFV